MKPELSISLRRAAIELNQRPKHHTLYKRLYKAVKKGRLKATQPGGKHKPYKVHLSDVERFLAAPARGR